MATDSVTIQASNARRLISTAAVIVAATIFGLTYSLSAPLIAVDLDKQGFSETFIGINAAMHPSGYWLVAPFLPRLAAWMGARQLTLAALLLSAGVLALFPLVPNIYWWFPLRIALGIGAEALFVMSETWTNELSSEATRGRTIALYTAALSLGMVCGPSLLSALRGPHGLLRRGGNRRRRHGARDPALGDRTTALRGHRHKSHNHWLYISATDLLGVYAYNHGGDKLGAAILYREWVFSREVFQEWIDGRCRCTVDQALPTGGSASRSLAERLAARRARRIAQTRRSSSTESASGSGESSETAALFASSKPHSAG